MSGGSYDYLCYKDAEDLLNLENTLEQMMIRLSTLGYAEDAAMETQQVILNIRKYKVQVNTLLSRLSPIWHAVEWWDSGDASEEAVKIALEEYREK